MTPPPTTTIAVLDRPPDPQMGSGGCSRCSCDGYSGVPGDGFTCGTNIGPKPTYCNHKYEDH